MTAVLEGEGSQVVGAANGQEVLGHLRTSPIFFVILLDLGMPVMDGWGFWAKQVQDPSMVIHPRGDHVRRGPPRAARRRAAGRLPGPVQWKHLLESVQHHC